MLTLGFASSLFYYNEINKKNEIVMTEELYNPSVYKEEVVELNLSNEEEPTTEVVPERVEVYDNLTIEELTDKLNRTLSSDLSAEVYKQQLGSVHRFFRIQIQLIQHIKNTVGSERDTYTRHTIHTKDTGQIIITATTTDAANLHIQGLHFKNCRKISRNKQILLVHLRPCWIVLHDFQGKTKIAAITAIMTAVNKTVV